MPGSYLFDTILKVTELQEVICYRATGSYLFYTILKEIELQIILFMKKYYYNYEYEVLRKKKITMNMKLFLSAAIPPSIY